MRHEFEAMGSSPQRSRNDIEVVLIRSLLKTWLTAKPGLSVEQLQARLDRLG
jgi:hypothetical protein